MGNNKREEYQALFECPHSPECRNGSKWCKSTWLSFLLNHLQACKTELPYVLHSFIHCFHCWHFIRYNASIQLSLFFFPFYQHNWWALAIQNINPPSGSDSCADIWLQGRLSISMCTQIWEMSSASSWGKRQIHLCSDVTRRRFCFSC